MRFHSFNLWQVEIWHFSCLLKCLFFQAIAHTVGFIPGFKKVTEWWISWLCDEWISYHWGRCFTVCLEFVEYWEYATEKSSNWAKSIASTRFATTAKLQTVPKRCLSSAIHFFNPQLKPTMYTCNSLLGCKGYEQWAYCFLKFPYWCVFSVTVLLSIHNFSSLI